MGGARHDGARGRRGRGRRPAPDRGHRAEGRAAGGAPAPARLERADFDRLRDAGYLRASPPVQQGGLWEDVLAHPWVCELFGRWPGDASVALVSAMHPAVLSLAGHAPRPRAVPGRLGGAARARLPDRRRGGLWGDDPSRGRVGRRDQGGPGDGGGTGAGALARARSAGTTSGAGPESPPLSRPAPARRRGGSVRCGGGGAGLVRPRRAGRPLGRQHRMRLLAEWDGHGMAATQSHGFAFEDFPAERFAWPGHLADLQGAAGAVCGGCFTAQLVGVGDGAGTAREPGAAPGVAVGLRGGGGRGR